jgi:predicted transcriptional regulator
MAAKLRPDAAVIEPSESEEHQRFVELLREGYEDVQAGRVVTNEELERILEDARVQRLARRSGGTTAK